jgi:hypothetical protein
MTSYNVDDTKILVTLDDESQHTPTPWELYGEQIGTCLRPGMFDPKGTNVVAEVQFYHPQAVASAEFIIRAANNHNDLVSALSEALGRISKKDLKESGCNNDEDDDEVLLRGLLVLARAQIGQIDRIRASKDFEEAMLVF